jgi:hypothetical protein
MDHVTAVFVVPVTVALNEPEAPGLSVMLGGTTVIATVVGGVEACFVGTNVMDALAECPEPTAIKVTLV